MKRKSILMTIVAVLFAGVAMGQTSAAWPVGALPADAANANASDTIYFCGAAGSTYPIELGYDVPGLRLSPSYGEWSLYAGTGTAEDYSFDNATKNEGAGNAFKVVGTTAGGYIFRYTSTDEQCGLGAGKSFYVYVFIMPDLNNVIVKDTLLCVNPANLNVAVSASFPHTDLYEKANVNISWNPTTWSVDRTTAFISDSVYKSVITVNSAPAGYTCPNTGLYQMRVRVVDAINLVAMSKIICEEDTISESGKGFRNPNEIFKRNAGGIYAPTVINNGTTVVWDAAEKATGKKVYIYTYTDCDGTNKTVSDTLKIVASPANKDWGSDTINYCRTPGVTNLFSLYDEATGGVNALNTVSTRWTDYGVVGRLPVNAAEYGTLNGLPSLQPIIPPATASSTIELDNMASSIGYSYRFRIDPSDPCRGNDSGMLVVILRDPIAIVDSRVQMCTDHKGTDFKLDEFTGVKGATWTAPSIATPIAGDKITAAQLTAMSIGTHKLSYKTAASDCSLAGGAVVYLTITDNPVISQNVVVKYCRKTIDPVINLNEILGFVSVGTTWSVDPASENASGVNITAAVTAALNNGVIVMNDLGAALDLASITGVNKTTLVFKLDGAACGVTGVTLTIEIVASIL